MIKDFNWNYYLPVIIEDGMFSDEILATYTNTDSEVISLHIPRIYMHPDYPYVKVNKFRFDDVDWITFPDPERTTIKF